MSIKLDCNNKKKCREHAKMIRNKLNINSISQDIYERLIKEDCFTSSLNILAYYPFKNEIDIRKIFQNKKNWFLPKCNIKTKELYIHSYKAGDNLIKNKWGILEPSTDKNNIDIKELEMIILPALAIDSYGYRLGYGGGFYDRLLPKLSENCIKLALIPDELYTERLPFNKWDIPVNKVITQSKIISIK